MWCQMCQVVWCQVCVCSQASSADERIGSKAAPAGVHPELLYIIGCQLLYITGCELLYSLAVNSSSLRVSPFSHSASHSAPTLCLTLRLSHSASHPVSHSASHPASHPATHSAAPLMSHSASHPVSHSASVLLCSNLMSHRACHRALKPRAPTSSNHKKERGIRLCSSCYRPRPTQSPIWPSARAPRTFGCSKAPQLTNAGSSRSAPTPWRCPAACLFLLPPSSSSSSSSSCLPLLSARLPLSLSLILSLLCSFLPSASSSSLACLFSPLWSFSCSPVATAVCDATCRKVSVERVCVTPFSTPTSPCPHCCV